MVSRGVVVGQKLGIGCKGGRRGGGPRGGYGCDTSGAGMGVDGVFDMGTEDDRGLEVVQVAVGCGRAVGSLRGGVSVTQSGTVEGRNVCDIVLDTGCSHTIIHQDLVPSSKKVPAEAVTIRCSHGDIALYPLADICIEIEGIAFKVRAALSQTLPVSVLLGTDVPQLGELLTRPTPEMDLEEAMVVTRSQVRESKRREVERVQKEERSAVHPISVTEEGSPASREVNTPEEPSLGRTFSDELFSSPNLRTRPMRQQERMDRHAHGLVRAKDKRHSPGSGNDCTPPPALAQWNLRSMQKEDESLGSIREHAEEGTQNFVEEDGLLYRKWTRRD